MKAQWNINSCYGKPLSMLLNIHAPVFLSTNVMKRVHILEFISQIWSITVISFVMSCEQVQVFVTLYVRINSPTYVCDNLRIQTYLSESIKSMSVCVAHL